MRRFNRRSHLTDRQALGELPEENLAERAAGAIIGPAIYRRGVGASGVEVTASPDAFEYRGKIRSNYYKTVIYPIAALLQAFGANLPDVVGKTNRAYLLMQNKGATTVFVGFGFVPDAQSGIAIFPNGNYELIGGAPTGAFVPPEDVYIRGSVGGENVVIVEGLFIRNEDEAMGVYTDVHGIQHSGYGASGAGG